MDQGARPASVSVIRQKDPVTGGEKESKLARFDLLPDSATGFLTGGVASDVWADLTAFWRGGDAEHLRRAGRVLIFALGPDWPTQLASVFGWGASKYAPRNWELGYAWSWSYAALGRHLAAYVAGESVDPESGLSHLAHALWHIVVLLDFTVRHRGHDDRPAEHR